MYKEKDARYQFRLPQDLLEKAVEKARHQDLSLAQVLRRFLWEWVENPPDESQEVGELKQVE